MPANLRTLAVVFVLALPLAAAVQARAADHGDAPLLALDAGGRLERHEHGLVLVTPDGRRRPVKDGIFRRSDGALVEVRAGEIVRGGKPAEAMKPAERRVPERLRHRDRAVSGEDQPPVASESPGATVHRAKRPLPLAKPKAAPKKETEPAPQAGE